jgi:putative hydrolase of the HAD superfamily
MAKELPKDCVFIGDDIEADILACQKINMRGIWLNRKSKPQFYQDVESITGLSELYRFLN